MLRKTGLAKQDAIISELLENTALRYRHFLRRLPVLISRPSAHSHGPVLNENLDFYLNLYQTWSAYEPEDKGVLIAYTSVYGNTKKAAELLAQMLVDKGCEKVAITDLARDDIAEAVEDAFRYDRLVLATTTYNGDVFPFMREFIESLTERNYQKRTIGLIENGSWAATAAKVMRQLFEKSKEITFTETTVKIMSALNEESTTQLENLAEELCK